MATRAHTYEELTTAAKRCRSLGHAWRPFDAERRGRRGWWVTLACSQCFCEKAFVMSQRGEIDQRTVRYRYPDHYLATFSVDGQGGKARMRLETLTGLLVESTRVGSGIKN